jgi:hypothetical protein
VFIKSLLITKLVALIAAFSVLMYAGPAPIGIITASGHFTVEHSEVWGNSTLFDGATVETGKASSDLALSNGVKVQLGAGSRAKVWQDRVQLEKGTGQFAGPYEVDAAGLKIHSAARISVKVTDRVEVASIGGIARVSNGAGLLMAAIPAGGAMSFAMQAAAAGAMTRVGCLVYKDGHFLLQDENTREVSELIAKDDATSRLLSKDTGDRVEVTGTAANQRPALPAATVVISVATIIVKSEGGCLSVASVLDAKTEAPAPTNNAPPVRAAAQAPKGGAVSTGSTGGGMKGSTILILVLAAGGGVGAALALAGKKSSTSP